MPCVTSWCAFAPLIDNCHASHWVGAQSKGPRIDEQEFETLCEVSDGQALLKVLLVLVNQQRPPLIGQRQHTSPTTGAPARLSKVLLSNGQIQSDTLHSGTQQFIAMKLDTVDLTPETYTFT